MDERPANVTVAAAPEEVWRVVSDEGLLGEWSDGWRRNNSRWTSHNKVLKNIGAPTYSLQWRTGAKLLLWRWRKWELNLTLDGKGTKITEKSAAAVGAR